MSYTVQEQDRIPAVRMEFPKEAAMTVIELQLDQETLERAQRVATRRQSTLEALLKEIIEFLAGPEPEQDPILGMFAHEPELIDEVVENAMAAREEHPLRSTNG
jgi:hypothetical protein